VVFDTDLLRYAVATDGGWIHQGRTDHTTSRGTRVPRTEGREWWATEVGPGWARNGSFEDPRPDQMGHLPPAWGRYRGYYRHGDEIVLSYTVGATEIHEFPQAVRLDGDGLAFIRTMSVGAGPENQAAYLLEAPAESRVTGESPTAVRIEGETTIQLVRLLDAPAGVTLRVSQGDRVELETEAHPSRRLFRLLVVELPREGFDDLARAAARTLLARPLRDPLALVGGGPARWEHEIETAVKAAVEGAGGYVRDRIEIPFENPWGSWMRLAGLAFFPDGKRAAVSTWNGDVWIVSGFSAGMETVQWKRFASGLYAPMGLTVVDGTIFVVEQGQLTRLHDLNGNGEADFFESFNNEGVLHPRSHSLCLEVDSEGNFYFFKNGNRTPDEIPDHGALIRVSADGKSREVFANGIRGANTLGVGPGDTLLGADQQGNWMPADRVDQYRQGGFYGYRPHGGLDREIGEFDAPILWMPHGLNNSSGSMSYAGDERWGPLAGKWILGSYGRGTLFALLTEEIDGLTQGGAVRLPFALGSGPIRSEMNPLDGQLYVLGIRGWGSNVQEDGSLDRIRYVGTPDYLPVGLQVEPDGIRLTFSEPLDPSADDISRYEVQRWQYIYSVNYGSGQVSADDPSRSGRDGMTVTAARLSPDRRSVFLQMADLRPVMQMRIGYDLVFADGHGEKNEIVHTVHRLNDGRRTVAPVVVSRSRNQGREVFQVEEEEPGVTALNGAKLLLEANCRACHQPPGSPGAAPALETSEWMAGGQEAMIRILLHGKMGEGGVMMPFAWMEDEDLAAILTYIRKEWHDGEAIVPEEIKRVRQETADRTDFWTAGELRTFEGN
jgi:mono/diheme cytochrome c family protein